jgi:hypothetical protein
MPLLSFCLGAMNLEMQAVAKLLVCWNDAFRKIFNMQRFESVKELIFYCEETDFSHIYDLTHIKFLKWFVQSLVTVFHYIVVLSGVIILFQT